MAITTPVVNVTNVEFIPLATYRFKTWMTNREGANAKTLANSDARTNSNVSPGCIINRRRSSFMEAPIVNLNRDKLRYTGFIC